MDLELDLLLSDSWKQKQQQLAALCLIQAVRVRLNVDQDVSAGASVVESSYVCAECSQSLYSCLTAGTAQAQPGELLPGWTRAEGESEES